MTGRRENIHSCSLMKAAVIVAIAVAFVSGMELTRPNRMERIGNISRKPTNVNRTERAVKEAEEKWEAAQKAANEAENQPAIKVTPVMTAGCDEESYFRTYFDIVNQDNKKRYLDIQLAKYGEKKALEEYEKAVLAYIQDTKEPIDEQSKLELELAKKVREAKTRYERFQDAMVKVEKEGDMEKVATIKPHVEGALEKYEKALLAYKNGEEVKSAPKPVVAHQKLRNIPAQRKVVQRPLKAPKDAKKEEGI